MNIEVQSTRSHNDTERERNETNKRKMKNEEETYQGIL